MTRQWYFIEPCDVWLFRDSKPFTAQQAFVARSMFPPTPQTMQGVIRTHYLETNDVDWKAFGRGDIQTKVGTPFDLGAFQLTGPFVARMVNGKPERYVPCPLDVRVTDSQCVIGAPTQQGFLTDVPVEDWRPVQFPDGGGQPSKEEASFWLDDNGLQQYLAGQAPGRQSVSRLSELILEEEHVGLALDHGRRTAREHHLYHAQFVRPKPGVGLLVEMNAGLLDPKGVMNIGGESRSGYFKQVAYAPPTSSPAGRVKIVLHTPAYFSEGWRPAGGDWSPWVRGGHLVSWMIGKPQSISGWDAARGEPRPLHHYVPAGSVYYFEDADLTGRPFTETPDRAVDHAAIGFGGYAAASWQ